MTTHPTYEYVPAGSLPYHRLADLFDLLEGQALDSFVEDVRANGQRIAAVAYRGELIDGRNRDIACQRLGRDLMVEVLPDDTDPRTVIRSLNIERRHMTTDQRAAIAAEFLVPVYAEAARQRQLAGVAVPDDQKGTAAELAARDMAVSAPSVKRAARRARTDPPAHERALKGKTRKARPGTRRQTVRTTTPEAPRLSDEERARANLRETVGWIAERSGPETVVAIVREALAGRLVICSFCGKDQEHVATLVQDGAAAICNECIELAIGIVRRKAAAEPVTEQPAEPEADQEEITDDQLRQRVLDDLGDESRRSYAARVGITQLTLKRVLDGTGRINRPTRTKLLLELSRS